MGVHARVFKALNFGWGGAPVGRIPPLSRGLPSLWQCQCETDAPSGVDKTVVAATVGTTIG